MLLSLSVAGVLLTGSLAHANDDLRGRTEIYASLATPDTSSLQSGTHGKDELQYLIGAPAAWVKPVTPFDPDLERSAEDSYGFRSRLQDYQYNGCLLYTSPSPRDKRQSRMPSSA